jgi:hypothetical protein
MPVEAVEAHRSLHWRGADGAGIDLTHLPEVPKLAGLVGLGERADLAKRYLVAGDPHCGAQAVVSKRPSVAVCEDVLAHLALVIFLAGDRRVLECAIEKMREHLRVFFVVLHLVFTFYHADKALVQVPRASRRVPPPRSGNYCLRTTRPRRLQRHER